MWVAHKPETITRGVHGTPIVGDRAKTMARATSRGEPPRIRSERQPCRPPPPRILHVSAVVFFPSLKRIPILDNQRADLPDSCLGKASSPESFHQPGGDTGVPRARAGLKPHLMVPHLRGQGIK